MDKTASHDTFVNIEMDKTIRIIQYDSPCGPLFVGSVDNLLCLVAWAGAKNLDAVINRLCRRLDAIIVASDSPATACAVIQLEEYFRGRRRSFDMDLSIVGSEFQREVWAEVAKIPYGETVTYAVISERIGKPSATRAVANAIGMNAISIVVPCHRIVGSDGGLTGYAGGIAAKRFLLDIERQHSISKT